MQVTKINNISDADVADAPTWDIVSVKFWAWCIEQAAGAPVVLIAHNLKFDASFLAAEDARLIEAPTRPALYGIDTLPACRKLLPNLLSHRQCAVYEHLFGRQPEAQHSAVGDVQALVEICSHDKLHKALRTFQKALDLAQLGDTVMRINRAPQPPPPKRRSVEATRPIGGNKCDVCGVIFSHHFVHICAHGGGSATEAAAQPDSGA